MTFKQHLAKVRIGVDVMGNDNDPKALIDTLKEFPLPPHVEIVFIATAEFERSAAPFPFQVAPEYISMEDHPLFSLRRKKNASMCMGMRF